MRRGSTCCQWRGITILPLARPLSSKVPLTRTLSPPSRGFTLEGKMCMQTQDHSYKGPDVARFLQLLLREIPGKLLVIWDGASIHRSQPIKDFLTKGGAKRIHLERLPSYAPEINPQEGVWNLLKRVELKNVCCLDVPHVQREVRRAKERLRHRVPILRQCFAHAGYSL